MSNKTAKLNELENLVRVEKLRIADETLAELKAGTFDITVTEATKCLCIAKAHIEDEILYLEECKEEAEYGWNGLWTRVNEFQVTCLRMDLAEVSEALKKANEAFEAKIPF